MGRGGTRSRRAPLPLLLALLAAVLGTMVLAAAPTVRADPPARRHPLPPGHAKVTLRVHAGPVQLETTPAVGRPPHAVGRKGHLHAPAPKPHHRSAAGPSHRAAHGARRTAAASRPRTPATSAAARPAAAGPSAAGPALAVAAPRFAAAVTSPTTSGATSGVTSAATSRAGSRAASSSVGTRHHRTVGSAAPKPHRAASPPAADSVPAFLLPRFGPFESPAAQLWTVMGLFTGLVAVMIVRERLRRRPGRARSLAS